MPEVGNPRLGYNVGNFEVVLPTGEELGVDVNQTEK
jgi:hypothetical protein